MGIDADAAPESLSTSADVVAVEIPESRVPNASTAAAPAVATPKRSSGLGAVKKSKSVASSSVSEQRSPQPTPDHRVGSGSGEAASTAPRAASTAQHLAADAHAPDPDHHNECPAASGETDPILSLPSMATDAAAESLEPHSAPAPAAPAAPARSTASFELQATAAAEQDAAEIDGSAAEISDRLNRRELQLEVRCLACVDRTRRIHFLGCYAPALDTHLIFSSAGAGCAARGVRTTAGKSARHQPAPSQPTLLIRAAAAGGGGGAGFRP